MRGINCGGIWLEKGEEGEVSLPGFALHVGEGRRVNGLC